MSARRTTSNARPPSPPENAIQSAIAQYLRLAGYYVQRMNAGAIRDPKGYLIRFTEPGTPDLWAVKGGRLLCVEVKRPGKRPTDVQLGKMAEMRAYGVRCIVACSVEDVQAALQEGI